MTSFAVADLLTAVGQQVPPGRAAAVLNGRVTTWHDLLGRAARFAGLLADRGVGSRERALEPLASRHDHVGLLLHNGPELLEAFLGSALAGASALGVNTRFTAREVAGLVRRLDIRVLVFSGALSAAVSGLVATAGAPLLVQVGPAPDGGRVDGALDYESELDAAASARAGAVHRPSSADLVVVTTGGTTGSPKGVLWRSDDFFMTALRGHELIGHPADAGQAVAAALADGPPRSLCPTPLVHFAGQAVALQALLRGGTALLMPTHRGFSADAYVALAEQHAATDGLVIGDVTARPIVQALRRRPRDLSALRFLIAGSTLLSGSTKQALLELVPHLQVRDSMGAAETGMQAVAIADASGIADGFTLLPGNAVLDRAGEPVRPGATGMICRLEHRSLGYYRDTEAMRDTYGDGPLGPWVTTGDTVQVEPDGTVALLGRDALTVNTGGEKVYLQEVESALFGVPGVSDCLAVGVPSPRWGQEVRALVVWDGPARDEQDVRDALRRTLAGYKVPKRVIAVPAVPRTAVGKADYAAARQVASEAAAPR
jgi:acyl-CoA synthetase (AMP-forming)/AMP-acid ligase II